MAVPDLQRILSQLRSESLDQLPIADTADRIEMLAADDLKKLKETEDAGKIASMVKDWRRACISASATGGRLAMSQVNLMIWFSTSTRSVS